MYGFQFDFLFGVYGSEQGFKGLHITLIGADDQWDIERLGNSKIRFEHAAQRNRWDGFGRHDKDHTLHAIQWQRQFSSHHGGIRTPDDFIQHRAEDTLAEGSFTAPAHDDKGGILFMRCVQDALCMGRGKAGDQFELCFGVMQIRADLAKQLLVHHQTVALVWSFCLSNTDCQHFSFRTAGKQTCQSHQFPRISFRDRHENPPKEWSLLIFGRGSLKIRGEALDDERRSDRSEEDH